MEDSTFTFTIRWVAWDLMGPKSSAFSNFTHHLSTCGPYGRLSRHMPPPIWAAGRELEKTAGPAAFNLAPQRGRWLEGVRHGPPGRQSYCPEPPSLEDHCKARRYAPVVEHATPTGRYVNALSCVLVLQSTIFILMLLVYNNTHSHKRSCTKCECIACIPCCYLLSCICRHTSPAFSVFSPWCSCNRQTVFVTLAKRGCFVAFCLCTVS